MQFHTSYLKFILIFTIITTINAKGIITINEFKKCAASKGTELPENIEYIGKLFVDNAQLIGNIETKLEALMAVAQMTYQSSGFTEKVESSCSNGQWEPKCDTYLKVPFKDGVQGECLQNNQYYGRGFLRLSHCGNYLAAAEYLKNSYIVTNPDIVGQSDDLAMKTALWFWRKYVHPKKQVISGYFGATTMAISDSECKTVDGHIVAIERYNLFIKCLNNVGHSERKVKEGGCYYVHEEL